MPFSIIIPSASVDKLKVCLNAIWRVEERRPRVIVIRDRIKGPLECESLEGVEPFIYARNVNMGIVASGDDDVILLNDDAVLISGSLELLMATATRCGGIVSAAVVGDVNNPDQQKHVRDRSFRETQGYLAFVCVAVPRAVIHKVGLLDERFGGEVDGEKVYGGEDVDYCHRAHEKGIGLYIYDGCVVDHGRILPSTFKRSLVGVELGMRLLREKWEKEK